MKKLTAKTFLIVMSVLTMLLAIMPFYVAELAEEQLPNSIENFFLIVMLLGFTAFAFSIILPSKKKERTKDFDEL